jgi:hypothetical protein
MMGEMPGISGTSLDPEADNQHMEFIAGRVIIVTIPLFYRQFQLIGRKTREARGVGEQLC